ncbi:MAG: hypothetical protein PHY48_14135 [Candidatus Cloacimonetes bacterium]|nr:hypothetical protein [Candidatus Cloacimonadota bacterium]
MSWSYDPENLATSKKDQVRFKLGDTVEADGLLQDKEIEYLLEQANGNVLAATLQGCQSIISRLSGMIDFSVGPYSESHGNRLASYRALYDQLMLQMSGMNPPIGAKPTTGTIFSYDMMAKDGCGHG